VNLAVRESKRHLLFALVSWPCEREQVDTVFEDRSGYLDLTTEGEDMINSSGIKDHPVVSHEEWLSAHEQDQIDQPDNQKRYRTVLYLYEAINFMLGFTVVTTSMYRQEGEKP
jgi:hypothetical protein